MTNLITPRTSRIVFSHIPIEFGPTRSADTENPTLEPNAE